VRPQTFFSPVFFNASHLGLGLDPLSGKLPNHLFFLFNRSFHFALKLREVPFWLVFFFSCPPFFGVTKRAPAPPPLTPPCFSGCCTPRKVCSFFLIPKFFLFFFWAGPSLGLSVTIRLLTLHVLRGRSLSLEEFDFLLSTPCAVLRRFFSFERSLPPPFRSWWPTAFVTGSRLCRPPTTLFFLVFRAIPPRTIFFAVPLFKEFFWTRYRRWIFYSALPPFITFWGFLEMMYDSFLRASCGGFF